MKKYMIFLFFVLLPCLGGCSIDYNSYYREYGDIYNKDDNLNSEKIAEDTKSYPYDNTELIEKYGEVYHSEINNYIVYASYYSTKYDTLYISYDIKDNPVQTIASKELALMEEHLLNYFISDNMKSDYKDYVNVVRVYPDYQSSVCREDDVYEHYSQIEGCALYDSMKANINLNHLIDIERFFNEYTYQEGGYLYTQEPKRDTFAHEFGHVSTYYNMILKGDDTYEAYLKIRLGDEFENVYPYGFPQNYDNEATYYVQPVEILADDYVELFYDVSKKRNNDYYDYQLEYNNLRNSLTNVNNVVKHLKDDSDLFDRIKDFYDLFIEKDYLEYDKPVAIKASGIAYNTMHDIDKNSYVLLDENNIIALGEVNINEKEYYRVILSNVVYDFNSRDEYSSNIGYILKSDCEIVEKNITYFYKYNGEVMDVRGYLRFNDTDAKMLPYYDFAYLIAEEDLVLVYDYVNDNGVVLQLEVIDLQ